jgi:hypothetical protein
MRFPLDFSFCFRNGDVGGDSGFEAALAFRNLEESVSELEGVNRKTSMTMHSTTPTRTVRGFRCLTERAGPMMIVGCLQFERA